MGRDDDGAPPYMFEYDRRALSAGAQRRWYAGASRDADEAAAAAREGDVHSDSRGGERGAHHDAE